MALRVSFRRAVATLLPQATPRASSSSRAFSTHSDQHSSVLVRDFIASALYDPLRGYFSANSDAVGSLTQPLEFHRFHGRASYLTHLQSLYHQSSAAWFTPVELFQPWYAYAIAEYVLHSHHSELPLRIYEIGGGTGTCACNILDYIKATAPSVYETLEYVSVEISSALAEKQRSFVYRVKSHQARYRAERRRAQDRDAWGPGDDNPCFVIMLEVIDNLPHDLVFRVDVTKPWMETWVCKSEGGLLSETRRPLQDPLIKHCLSIIETGSADSESAIPDFGFIPRFKGLLSRLGLFSDLMWMPTGCLEMLQTLHQARPNLSLILSDFSTLPDVQIPGERAPLVASKHRGLTKDHITYLEATGNADIFFPTDFRLLQQLDHHCSSAKSAADMKRLSSIVASGDFMKAFAQTSKTQTKDGYNPLLEDYSNTKFYLSRPTRSVGCKNKS